MAEAYVVLISYATIIARPCPADDRSVGKALSAGRYDAANAAVREAVRTFLTGTLSIR